MIPSEPLLRLRDVSVRYLGAAEEALRGVSLDIAAGELVTLAGRTGAGTTTLALAAAGFIPRPVRAEVTGTVAFGAGIRPAIVLGRPSSQLSGARATVREEIAFGLENLGVPRDEMADRVETVLQALAIGHLAERSPEALSGGEQQRVAIAAILAMGPGLLVVDEPTSHLDPAGAAALADLLAASAEGGTAVLAAELHPDVLARSSRTLLLDDGRVVADDRPAAALRPDRAAAAGIAPPGVVRLATAAGVDPGLAFDEAAIAVALLQPGRPAPEVAAALAPPRIPLTWQPVRNQPPADVQIEGLVFRYPDGVTALRGLDLSIRAGAAVAVVGANGSGKTTLARHLNGLLRPSDGTVRVAGAAVADEPVHRNAARVGLALADPADMLFARTVEEELRFGPRELGVAATDVERLVVAALEAIDMTDLRAANPHDLAPAHQRLVALAAVLAADPALVVLDEPTSGLDPAGVARVGAIVDALRGAGRTIVAITPDMNLAAGHFDRVIVLREGRVVLDGGPREVFAAALASPLAEAGLRPPLAARMAARLELTGVPLDEVELLEMLVARHA